MKPTGIDFLDRQRNLQHQRFLKNTLDRYLSGNRQVLGKERD